jgi:FdhD protein
VASGDETAGGGRLGGRVARATVARAGAPLADDLVAVEEPLEIRIAGETVAVVMRTPGDDHRLALGFLFGEGLLREAADASAVFHCGRKGEEGYGNVIDVAPASGAAIDWAKLDASRAVSARSSACGVCGRATIDDLLAGIAPLRAGEPIPASELSAAVAALRRHQPAYDVTGGTHCAALYARGGTLIAAHEDVGRHNAVDKVIGALLLARAAGPAPEPALLAVSSRAGFEIVQKAARAGIAAVACVSAPTSLAIALAERAGIALAGFVRGGRMNVYAGAERIPF